MPPLFTNDAVVFGLLMIVLAAVFYTSSLDRPGWQKFYRFVPSLLLCYFLPALMHWPLGWIAPHWYDTSLIDALIANGLSLPSGFSSYSFEDVQRFLTDSGLSLSAYSGYVRHSQLYYVASQYLLPASLVLLCLSIDLKGIIGLGPKSIIMFFSATLGIIIGGPIALMIALNVFPHAFEASPDEVWRGLSTVAGSWIGGGANQTAMKEIYQVSDNLFGSMIVVDVIVANMWMACLLYGAGITDTIDRWLKADASAITELRERVRAFRDKHQRIPTTTDTFMLIGISFGAVAISHWGTGILTPWMSQFSESLNRWNLTSLMSSFFWLIVIATTIGVALSFTRVRQLEGVGASRMGSVFIYILVATIGMKMNMAEIGSNMGIFFIGLIWMLTHVTILLITAKLIRAPFFFVAVGSQANVGGAASAPIVASAFDPALAPVGVLMAVLGYALGTYGGIICATLMSAVVG